MSSSYLVLHGYDRMMQTALYEDTLNYYLTVVVTIMCGMVQTELNRKDDAAFFELFLEISLCTKLGYPLDLPSKMVKYFNRYMDESKPTSYNALVVALCQHLKTYIPTFKYYVHDAALYETANGLDDWSSVMGPLVWTWGHLTFANTREESKRQQFVAFIIIFDVVLGCVFCRNHYISYKKVLFSQLAEEFAHFDAENAFLDIHSFVTINLKSPQLSFEEVLATWYKLRHDIREEFRDEYRELEADMLKENSTLQRR